MNRGRRQPPWNGRGSTAEGEWEDAVTADTEAAGRTVRASGNDPQYRVRRAASGRDAVHKPEALRPRND
ncbi:DUF2945 domain-containing protein [Nocardia sp. CA-290969]|uniref:DUF2945 domain-containing protein n=1 Tax=Nocardia sp. CA-290969 TaxID=3239986 RepID=UPI003D924505